MSISIAIKKLIQSNRASQRVASAFRRLLRPTDAELLRRLVGWAAGRVEQPFFVKVGANDGLTGDPFGRAFLEHTAWSGLLVEPVPYCVKRLRQVYQEGDRFRIEAVAVGAESAVLPFYFVREEAKSQFPDLPPYFDQLGSFDRQHIVSHLGGMLEPFIEELPIAVERLHDLIQKHRIKDISILHIDTEGFDYQVLQGLQMEVNRPRWILLESKHFTPDIRTAVVQLLSRNLYDVYDLGKDFFACQRNQPDSLRLRGRFRRLLRQPLHNSDETS